jgi:hypothetical protein
MTKDLIWKIIGSIGGVVTIGSIVYALGVNNASRDISDREIINTLHNVVIPEIRQLHAADSCQTVKLIEIERSMVTTSQFKSLDSDIGDLKKNQGIMLKFNEDALKEIKKQKEIDELTQRKANMFDELKKNDKLNAILSDIK